MPRLSSRVLATERAVQSAKAKGGRSEFRIKGARNLVLRVTPHGTKSWLYVYRSPATGRWAKTTLGSYPVLSLAAAKKAALEVAVAINSGKDPIAARLASRNVDTFEQFSQRYMVEHERKNARVGKPSRWTREVRRLLDADILPAIANHRIDAVTKGDVSRIVEAVAARGSLVAADRVLGIVRSIFNWGVATGRLDINPTSGLGKRNASKPRDRVLNDDELRTLWRALETTPKLSAQVRDALRLQLLLGLRIGEALGTAKSEIDLDKHIWTIPGVRTKSGREHRLPLSDHAASIIQAAMESVPSSPWLFPSPFDGTPVRAESASRALLRLRRRIDIQNLGTHDLRRTCATRLGDMGVEEGVIGRILNHAPSTVTGKHYNHARLFEPMRQALEAWADELERLIKSPEQPSRTQPLAAEIA